ncbi:hypothetical protein BD410DRAFT_789972 [Rickenella mellea]|uniref:Uncharacterized protein n=1 Tax=Rickenella mellea TaxID=50990 RepID=A0A4Y7Q2Y1_9AGAM|nr:hypothetical protein BD410DRAFT_789972 [Rickenella mellea]
MELSKAGMVDGPDSSPFTLDERMARLKDYVSAWEAPQLHDPETIKVREPCIWNMTGGLLSYATFGTGNDDGSATTTNLVFRKLASQTRCIEGRVWSYDVPGKVYLMETDLYQDLLILVTMDPITEVRCAVMHISFHQLSTGETHRNAKHPVITQEVGYEAVEPNQRFISLCRNYVAILCYEVINDDREPCDYVGSDEVHVSDSQFFIIDWESGDLIWRINDAIRSFTFISENLVLLALLSNSKDPPLSGVLAVVDFSNQHRASCCSVTSALLLPILTTNAVAYEISVRSSPPPKALNQSAVISDHIPFGTDPESRLITVNLHVRRWTQFLFCIPLSTIQRSITMCGGAQEVNRLMDCVEQGLPWESWGPQATQMISRVGLPGFCYAWGSRCTFALAGRVRRSRYVKFCDFNPLLVKEHLHSIQTTGEGKKSQMHINNPKISDIGIFQGGDTTSLSYLESSARLFEIGDLMFNEDNLLIINRDSQEDDEDEDGDSRTFDIYQIS